MLDNKVSNYLKEVSSIHDLKKRTEMIVRGALLFFPFERASIFTFSLLNYIGEGIFQVENNRVNNMDWIKEDIRSIPSVYLAVMNNQPLFIDTRKNNSSFPEKYIRQFDLTSLAIVPISRINIVVGCVFMDRYTGDAPILNMYIKQLYMYFQHAAENIKASDHTTLLLSRRETEVLQHLADGYSLKEMASFMKISEFTVRDYFSSVNRKLGVKHRSQAVAEGFRKGILK
ncbi:LuxR C-terminal-related transcriptional regulator [Bacillus sp. MUM 13]|uniref:response regulator transcription factor n=1 Tax=Bacillus sp. MUM 13 TaxID=1678001 RepID=UPI0008F5D3B1|nr:LuxR C-terminal-related transcriptional regulator [Bacillus sp. MUM 13]OIK14495.1 hypothetical protein BIV59_02890 [Bacillus sp. MUM 13]